MRGDVIICHNLNIVCFEDDMLVQKSIFDKVDHQKIAIACYESGNFYISDINRTRKIDPISAGVSRAFPTDFFQKEYMDAGLITVKCGDSFMRANGEGKIDFIAQKPLLWEKFRLVKFEHFLFLEKILKNNWSDGKSEFKINREKSNFNKIFIGEFEFYLNEISDHYENDVYANQIILHSGWKVFQLKKVRPIVVFVVFGTGRVLKEFCISVDSLVFLANYEGDICIITNNKSAITNLDILKNINNNIIYYNMVAFDKLDFVGARLSVFLSENFDEYQPILYSDTDVVFDKDIKPFLIEASTSTKCSAQIELFDKFKTGPHVGGLLYTEDPFEIPDVHGFNAGIFMIPNMAYHLKYVKAAYKSLKNYTERFGRNSLPFYDQAALNYVLYKLNDFDGEVVSKFTRIGGSGNPTIQHDYGPDINFPSGFVHFWNCSEKHKEMSNYLDEIKKKNEFNGSQKC